MEFSSIASGSSGNCTFASTDNTSVLVDAGITCKRIVEGMNNIDRDPSDLDGILVTHEHIDHIKAIGVMSRKYHIPIYAGAGTIEYMKHAKSLGAVDPELFHEITPDQTFEIGDITVDPFRIWHDAADPMGFRLSNNGHSVAVATDMGCYNDYIVDHLQGLDGILLESNHDVNMVQCGPYPWPLKQRILGQFGHLSNESAGDLLCRILHDGMKKVLLGHLSKENNYEALALAAVTTQITMDEGKYKGDDFDISVASRDTNSPLYAV